jgi:hypothetical protein
MSGRQRSIDAVTATGDVSLNFSTESGNIATSYECHRSYFESTDPFAERPWKYYEHVKGNPKLCSAMGKLKDNSGVCRGISMWEPHCFPKALIDCRQNRRVKCKKLLSTNNLSQPLVVVEDRRYSATIAGNNVDFTHFLLTPGTPASENTVDDAFRTIVTEDCQFKAGSHPKVLDIDFDDCDSAVGPMFAGQCSLKQVVNDDANTIGDRCDAMILFAWNRKLGSQYR